MRHSPIPLFAGVRLIILSAVPKPSTKSTGELATQIRRATADEVIDLRHAILRAGLPRETAVFPGDDDPAARHFVATRNGRVVGCATLHLNRWEKEPAWQLR